jgi:pyrimidine operon attenuation protein/uracil phosphoribosyltransferase
MQRLMDADGIQETIRQIADRLVADEALRSATPQPLALVGIRSRGELIAQRLAAELAKRQTAGALPIDVGTLDITFYRDDLASRRAITVPRGTDMNFRLDDRPVILCDDVLETGRSIRAALDALVDFGRPRLIRLAVLIDRGRREFPIAADYVGLTVHAPGIEQKIVVHLQPTDSEDAVYMK